MAASKLNVLMIGAGEYTTGYTATGASGSDKKAGVVALTMFDLRGRGMIGRLGMCCTDGRKFPKIRAHMQKMIVEAYPGSKYDATFDEFPSKPVKDYDAYKEAIDSFKPGDAVIIFTPDNTHFAIALYALQRGLHVLLTKPMVKTLDEHQKLIAAADASKVLCMCEVHKRWDPIYTDARDRIQKFGGFSFINAYMSQPKVQLDTFRNWAGKSSDISYYLNSHHIDFHSWCVGARSEPVSVVATAATGVAAKMGIDTEDTITLTTQWKNADGTLGVAVYTSSWIAPPSDVHSQQRFFYMGQSGQVRVDQAHRGYSTSTDASGYASCNPLFMKYAPSPDGRFVGQRGYGYLSFEAFVEATLSLNQGRSALSHWEKLLPTVKNMERVTAILQAGRESLDAGGACVAIAKDQKSRLVLQTPAVAAASAVEGGDKKRRRI